MIKNLIAPIQHWLLDQGFCVACGHSLEHAKKATIRGKITVTCNCGRIFILENGKYRRALFEEI